jgi:hypothetical protein
VDVLGVGIVLIIDATDIGTLLNYDTGEETGVTVEVSHRGLYLRRPDGTDLAFIELVTIDGGLMVCVGAYDADSEDAHLVCVDV